MVFLPVRPKKCQNFLRVWHLVIYREDQEKNHPVYAHIIFQLTKMHQQDGEGKETLSLSNTRNTSHMATKCQILRSLNLSPLCDTNFVYDFKHDSPFYTQKLTKIQLGQVRIFPQYGNDSHLHQAFFPENINLSLICKTTDYFCGAYNAKSMQSNT